MNIITFFKKSKIQLCLLAVLTTVLSCDFAPPGYHIFYTGEEPALHLDVDNSTGKSFHIESFSEGWTQNWTTTNKQLVSDSYLPGIGEFLLTSANDDNIMNLTDSEKKNIGILKVLEKNVTIKGDLSDGVNGLDIDLNRLDLAARYFIARRDSILPKLKQDNTPSFDYGLYREGHSEIIKLLDDYIKDGSFFLPGFDLSLLQEALRCNCLSEQEVQDYILRYFNPNTTLEKRMKSFNVNLRKYPLWAIGQELKEGMIDKKNRKEKIFNSSKTVQIIIDFSSNFSTYMTNELLAKLNVWTKKYRNKIDFVGVKCFECSGNKKTFSIQPEFPVYKANKIFNDRGTYYYPEEPGPRVLILDQNKKVLLNTYADEQLPKKIDVILAFLSSKDANTELKSRPLNEKF